MMRLPLVGNILTRRADVAVDQFYKNCYPETVDENNPFVTKRPGLKASLAFSSGAGRGIYNWNGNLYSVIGNTVRKGSSALSTTLATTTGKVYFSETGGGTPKLIINDLTNLYIIDASDNLYWLVGGDTTYAAWVMSTAYNSGDRVIPTVENGFFYNANTTGTSDSSEPTWPTTLGDTVVDNGVTWECAGYYTNLPDNMVSGVSFMDQYIFVMDSAGAIYNTNVNDPTTITASDFITAEDNPDVGVRIHRHLNYIVGFGQYSIEFFYDAANASGSPLSRVSEAVNHVGCVSGDTVASMDNFTLFLGRDRTGEAKLYGIEGLATKIVSTKAVDRIINSEGSNLSAAYGYVVKSSGHVWYVLTLTSIGKTLVYDLIDKVWHSWSSYNGSTETYFTGVGFAEVGSVGYILDKDNGDIYELDEATYQDASNTIKVQGTTDIFDGDIIKNKFCTRLEVVGDRAASAATLSISWSDDDYATFNTPRNVDLNSRALLTRLGKFRRRAFRYTFEENLPMRLEAFDIEVLPGEYGQ